MHERISVNSLCFMGSSLAEQAVYWRELGARRVSFMSPLLLADGGAAAREVLRSGTYQFETISHGPFIAGPLTPQRQQWSESRDTIMRLIDMAAELGGRSVYMLTGGHGSLTWEEAAECFCAAIAPCAEHARKSGIGLAIENAPLLYADAHIAHSLRDTIALAEMAGIGVCIELFGCWPEADLRASFERAMPRCYIVQVSDYVLGDRSLPARAVPGDGTIPLARLLKWIIAAGYKGAFDLELLGPRIDREGHVDAARRAADHVGRILQSLGV